MACNGCNSSAPVSKDQVENILNKALKEVDFLTEKDLKLLINEMIDAGKLQSGLLTCDATALPKGSKVPTCDMLKDTTLQSIVADKENKTVTFNFSDGTNKELNLSTWFGDQFNVTKAENGDVTIVPNGKDPIVIPAVKVDIAESDDKFTFTKQDGSQVEVPKHRASIRVTNAFGNVTLGYIHSPEDLGVTEVYV